MATKTVFKQLFYFNADREVTLWNWSGGHFDVVTRHGDRALAFTGDDYWEWVCRQYAGLDADLDVIVLTADEKVLDDLSQWVPKSSLKSSWKRHELEQLAREEEFSGKCVQLLANGEERTLCRAQGEKLRLHIWSSKDFELEKGVADDLDSMIQTGQSNEDAPIVEYSSEKSSSRKPIDSLQKSRLLGICDELKKVVVEKVVPYGDGLDARLEALKGRIEDYVFRVYLVGPFSCGKSSLLNRWLKMPRLLPTGINPETAISTELHYGESERMVLYPLKQDEPTVTLEGISDANMDLVRDKANHRELVNVAIYLPHPTLRTYSDLCLVDLPGLSSANPAHEAALDRFIAEQEAGVFCVPMADGTVQGDVLEFLKKMERFHSRFNLLLTKADEKPESDHASIMKATGKGIRQALGLSANDFTVGKVSSNSVDAFSKMVDDFQKRKDEYLNGRFGWEIRGVADEIEGPLRKALSVDYRNAKLDEAIGQLETAEKELPLTMQELLENVRQEVCPATDRVLAQVKGAVMAQKSVYLAMARQGQDCSPEVSSLVKSTIGYAVGNEMQDVIQRVNEKAETVLGRQLDIKFGDAGDVSASVDGVPMESESEGSRLGSVLGSAGGGGAGFWLGNIILPGIGGIVGGLLGGLLGGLFSRGKRTEDVSSRIEAEFTLKLDAACKQTRPKIEELLHTAVAQYGESLKAAVEGKIKSLKEQAAEIKAKQEAGRETWDKHQAKCQKTLKTVKEVLSKLGDENVQQL